MPTFHPAYLLRNPAEKKLAWEDLQQVMKFFGKHRSRKQPTSREGSACRERSRRTTSSRRRWRATRWGTPPARRSPSTCRRATRRAPRATRCVYFLHGFTGSGARLAQRLRASRPHVPERLDALIDRGTCRPSSASSRTGGRARRHAVGQQRRPSAGYRDYLVKDVVAAWTRRFRTAAHGGLARGGGAQLRRLRRAGDGPRPPGRLRARRLPRGGLLLRVLLPAGLPQGGRRRCSRPAAWRPGSRTSSSARRRPRCAGMTPGHSTSSPWPRPTRPEGAPLGLELPFDPETRAAARGRLARGGWRRTRCASCRSHAGRASAR